MKVLVEAIPCGVFLPDDLEPVLAGAPVSYANALGVLARALEAKDVEGSVEAARAAVLSIALRIQVDAVLYPRCLDVDLPMEAHIAAGAAFCWDAESRGLLVLFPVDAERGMGAAALPESVASWQAMREGDPVRRVELWRKRWDAVLRQELAQGRRSLERQLVAGFLADDPDAREILRWSRPDWLYELDQEVVLGAKPIPWRKAIRDLERLSA